MISIDSNLLLYAINTASPFHTRARQFLEDLASQNNVGLSELVLVEFYTLLRNPVVLTAPLPAADAAAVIQAYRQHPHWALFGYATDSRALHEELWRLAAQPDFSRRRIYDARIALTLRRHGITDFATANVRDFKGLGFDRVWNPLDE